MSISCSCGDEDGAEWYYTYCTTPTRANWVRRKRCISCKRKMDHGDLAHRFRRFRNPHSDLEERIHGNEVPLADWWMCPGCFAIFYALDEIGACVDLKEDDMRDSLDEFNRDYAPKGFRLKVLGMEVQE